MSASLRQKETNSASANIAATRSFVTSKNAKRTAVKQAKQKQSGTMKFQGHVRESIGDASDQAQGRRFRVTLIREGLGNFVDCFYYTKESVQSMVPLFEGAQARANHQTQSQDQERPEGDVLTVFGYYENVSADLGSDGCTELNADLVICDGPAFDRERGLMKESVVYSKRHQGKSFIGLSINAGGDFDTTTFDQFMSQYPIPAGALTKIQEALSKGLKTVYPVRIMTMADSCDMVTVAGAGGRVNQILESNKERAMPKALEGKQESESQKESEQMESQKEDGAGGDGDNDADDQPGGSDAAQDEELILQMLKKYLGDGFSDEQKSMAKEAYETAKASGMEHDDAMKCAGHHMQMLQAQSKVGKNPAGVQNPPAPQAVQAEGGKEPPPADGDKAKESESEESEKKEGQKEAGKDLNSQVIKLTAANASLQARLDKIDLDAHMDKVLRESKLPMTATKKFRECAKDVKSMKEFDEKFSIFKEAYGVRGEASSEFILETEKTTGADGSKSLDFSDCVEK